jgi:hypothetical protein
LFILTSFVQNLSNSEQTFSKAKLQLMSLYFKICMVFIVLIKKRQNPLKQGINNPNWYR